jgi:peptidoglycan L-alanyl-D-glutamate endopeptidase CwlK
MPSFSKTSADRLFTCEQQLRKLFDKVVEKYDCTILEGHRGQIKQDAYFNATPQRSGVKWPNGKHNKRPSEAVDAAPYPIPENWGADHWKDMVKFYEFAAIVRYEAALMNIKIRWGGDWDGDGDYRDQTFDDLVHFELRSYYESI